MSVNRHRPIGRNTTTLLHGGDYNPEQWVNYPEVWDEDMRLLKQANCNCVTVGVFAWTSLEPEEGKFSFGWLDTIFDKLEANGTHVILATPTGARPAWMAQKYPEVLRCGPDRNRRLYGHRHNHCFTSPIYREKAAIIATKLAERYGKRPNLAAWHVNNEYSGDCHCPLCQDAFRAWIRRRYKDNLNDLNHAWWAAFWSHGVTDFSQVESPSPIGEPKNHGLNLDWKRFTTDQTIEFFRAESAPLKKITPDVPITTNYIGGYPGLDYYKLARELDFVSWDSYPRWYDKPEDWKGAITVSFLHHQRRAMLNKPFLMMECTPSVTNYAPVNKLKRPGLHKVESLHAIGCGSDSVLYFQWRKSRGSTEKFHGAVVDHYPSPEARVFKEVADLGATMQKISPVVGMRNEAKVGIIYDYESRWALDDASGPRNDKKNYLEICVDHYRPFFSSGVAVDIISQSHSFDRYKLLIAPMLYLVQPGVAERIDKFVSDGGTFITTYMSGIVNETDLCFRTGFPGPFRKMAGVWAEETDTLTDDERVPVNVVGNGQYGLTGSYSAMHFCDIVHAEGAEILATYGSEFYAGTPAVTVRAHGKGKIYYIAARMDDRFTSDLMNYQIDSLGLRRALGVKLPDGVTAEFRTDGKEEFIFLCGFNREEVKIELGAMKFTDKITGGTVTGSFILPRYSVRVLARA